MDNKYVFDAGTQDLGHIRSTPSLVLQQSMAYPTRAGYHRDEQSLGN